MAKTPVITQQNFLRYLRRQEEEALVYVAREYGGLIRSVLSRQLLGNPAIPSGPSLLEECINDVLLAVWEHSDCFDPRKSTFENWLCGVCRHKAQDALRRQRRQAFISPLEDIPVSAEDFTDSQEMELDLDELLSPLSKEDRKLFVRRYLEGQSVESLSEQMGLHPHAIYNRLSKGRKKLRSHLLSLHRRDCQP